jgi:magnesium chelatase subunit H
MTALWMETGKLGKSWGILGAIAIRSVTVDKIKGQARPEILTQLLQTTSRIVQEIDSVEYGLTDIKNTTPTRAA